MNGLPKITKKVFQNICKDFAKTDYTVDYVELFTEQALIAEELAVGFVINPAMAKGFLLCYQALKEQLKANEVKELEELEKL